ncbi:hypothetical protein M9Y10_006371 [Tritrichomonas musculus]|uniref:DUF3447 domain-containing protein n=1 Tax=Tritrichomonas musculus TaxID=1915356 RepID=A0ABR2JDZ7_9EUKA
MQIQQFLAKMNEIQTNVLTFIERDTNSNEDFENLKLFLNSSQIKLNRQELREFLLLINNISANYSSYPTFYEKIERIILIFRTEIQQFYSNFDVFMIFHSNKRILLFLIQQNLLNFDQNIAQIICSEKYYKKGYCSYFYHELHSPNVKFNLLIQNKQKQYLHGFQKISPIVNQFTPEEFEKNRQLGQNHTQICNLVRNDMINEFIVYVNQTNYPLTAHIEKSLFETNPFLIENKKVTLLEYAAFFGAIQIIRYLKMNNVDFTESIWPYAIHSNNAELIHLLEEDGVRPKLNQYSPLYVESIKCHHNNIANYIFDNFLNNVDDESTKKHRRSALKSHNYEFFLHLNNFADYFQLLCKYNYVEIVSILLNNSDLNLINVIVSYLILFIKFFIQL